MNHIGPAVYLDIDLTIGTIQHRELPEELFRMYPGGSSLATYLLLREMPAGVESLSPDNILVLAVGPATTLPISGISRVSAAAKSPLTGAIGDSQAGGYFPTQMARAGVHALMFRGRAPEPTYLWLKDGVAELRSATHLWGKATGEVDDLIKEELGDSKIEIAQCGIAGERGVRYAAIINMSQRANGRTGMGAVMGSKNLKAVAVRGSSGKKPVDAETWKRLAGSIKQRIKDSPDMEGLSEFGTDGMLGGQNDVGGLPTRNWATGHIEGAEALTGQTMTNTILIGHETCFGCAVHCKRVVEVPGRVDPRYGGPEYETCSTFGSYCGITDLVAVSEASQFCNMYGLDTISCGATIAFAMEANERGLIPADLRVGYEDLRFGNAEAMVRLVKDIAFGSTPLGRLLGEGSLRAGTALGCPELSISVKGLEFPAHMPQVKRSLALIYAVNPFGADHQSSEHDPAVETPPGNLMRDNLEQLGAYQTEECTVMSVNKVQFTYTTQLIFSLCDTLCLCDMVWGPSWEAYGPNDLVDMVKASTGWDVTLGELMQIGERRINLMKMFNVREGFTRKDDQLPERLFTPLPSGPSKGLAVDREEQEKALDVYYAIAGWDQNGRPTRWKLESLGLGWLVEEKSK
ncbi:MAG: aldehyde ferredoxin oxidoreductase family protein [Dehalobacterium sp.]